MRRWVIEVIGLLSARAPRLDRACKRIARDGGVVVLLDAPSLGVLADLASDQPEYVTPTHATTVT